MSTPSIVQGELIANITANGSSYWVSICIDSGENFMGQQVIKSRSYSSLKTAQRGAIKMMETLA
jgi:hypothetical protein